MVETVETVETDPEARRDRHALYLLDARNPAVWELLEAYPTRAEADANAAIVAQDERVRATRVLAFAAGHRVPLFLDNTSGDRDARAIAQAFDLLTPDEDAPETDEAGATRPPREEPR
jgi:hypothetical protein